MCNTRKCSTRRHFYCIYKCENKSFVTISYRDLLPRLNSWILSHNIQELAHHLSHCLRQEASSYIKCCRNCNHFTVCKQFTVLRQLNEEWIFLNCHRNLSIVDLLHQAVLFWRSMLPSKSGWLKNNLSEMVHGASVLDFALC